MNECLAAGIVRISGFDGRGVFIDPMCGSGTIAIEAAMVASRVAPGLTRESFGFFSWRDFDGERWRSLRSKAESRIVSEPTAVVVSADSDERALAAARRNARAAGVEKHIRFILAPFAELAKRMDADTRRVMEDSFDRVIVMNPPYGERIDVSDETSLYRSIGDTLKRDFPGFTAWVMTGSQAGRKSVGLRHSQSVALYNGPIECRLRRYEII